MNGSDYVWCVQVRSVDPPQFVAEAQDSLDDHVGGFHGFEQCDGCGNSAYELVREDNPERLTEFSVRHRYYMVCTEDPDDEISRQFGGCGARYRVHLQPSRNVQF